MMTRELELHEVFYNTNNHLSIVYEKHEDYLRVLNYNGSIYKVSRLTTANGYSRSNVNMKSFFNAFPKNIFDFYERQKFERIQAICMCVKEKEFNLLLIC